MRRNKRLQQLQIYSAKLKPQKSTSYELQNWLTLFENCLETNLTIDQYTQLTKQLIEAFLLFLHHLPYEGLYRSLRTLLQYGIDEIKSRKANILISNIITICDREDNNLQDKDIKILLTLVRKAGEKYYGTDIGGYFLEYYLERIESLPKTQLITGDAFHAFKNISTLMKILTAKYKQQMTQKLRQLTTNNKYSTILILIEFKNNPNIICNVFVEVHSKIIFPKDYLTPILSSVCIKFLQQFLIDCLLNSFFEPLPYLYTLFPSQRKLKVQQELYSRLLITNLFQSTKIELNHQELQQNQWKQKLVNFIKSRNISAQQKVHIFLKLATLICSKILDNALPHKHFPIITMIKQLSQQISLNPKNRSQKNEQFYHSYLECLSVIKVKYEQVTWEQFAKNGKCEEEAEGSKDFGVNVYEKCMKIQDAWRNYLGKFSYDSSEHRQMITEDDELMILQVGKQENIGNQTLSYWKIIIEVMIQQLKKNYDNSFQNNKLSMFDDNEISISGLAFSGLEYYGIRPVSIQKVHTENIKKIQNEQILKRDSFSMQCSRILCHNILKCASIDAIREHMKKILSAHFDKINDIIIKSLCNNIFFVQCILLTNSTGKVKILAESLLKKGENLSLSALQEQLAIMFSVKGRQQCQIIVEYVKYLATRDKLKFKLQLYEKKLTKFDYLIQEPTSSFLIS